MSDFDPNVIRTAAYQEAKARLDRKTRTGRPKCEPPNRPCGSRCIPPNWDCRLRGEGNDPHLRAVGKGSDPVSGLANIERGLGRLRKGALKLSFSELEGGRKAIARGTAKLTPADLKRKEEIKKQVDFFLGRVLLPVSAVVGAGLLHRGLKNFKGYREGPGQQVDDSAKAVFDFIRVNIPGYGQEVRRRQNVGREAIGAVNATTGRLRTQGPASVIPEAGQRRTLTELVRSQAMAGSEGISAETRTLLDQSLRRVDGAANDRTRPSKLSYVEWQPRSLGAFWSTPRAPRVTPAGITSSGSLFSVYATNDLLAKTYGGAVPAGLDLKLEGEEVISRLRGFLQNTGESLRTSMKEAGLDPRNPNAVRAYIGRVDRGTLADEGATALLVNSVVRSDHDAQAKGIYRNVLDSYDQLFQRVADDVSQGAPGIEISRGPEDRAVLESIRRTSFYNDAVEAHSAYLGRTMNLPAPVVGPYTGILARRAYHSRFVAGPRRLGTNNAIAISLTRNEAYNAGIEIARATGSPEPGNAEEALALVVRTYGSSPDSVGAGNAIGQIGLISGSAAERPRRAAPPRPAGEAPEGGRPARRRTRSRAAIISDLLKQRNREGNPVYTPESAATEADRLIALRQRNDARTEAYLLVRQDYTDPSKRKGQPCGKSFIPKRAKCSKPTSARYADKPKPEKKSEESLASKVGKAGLVTGVVAAGAALSNRRVRRQLRSSTQKAGVAAKRGVRATKVFTRRQRVLADRKMRRAFIVSSKKAVDTLSTEDVKNGLSKLPKEYQETARNLVGRAKTAAAGVALNAEGYKVQTVDVANNFTTFRNKKGSLISIGSYGDSLVTYYSNKSHTYGKKDVYIIGFNVDQDYDATRNMPAEQASAITRGVRKMTNDQLSKIDNGVLATFPWDGDEYGQKRRRIYNKMGFNDVMGEDSQWALVENGKIKKMSQMEAFLFEAESGANAAPITKPVREKSEVTRRVEIITRLLRERDENGRPKYTREAARKEAERQLAETRRGDVYEQVKHDVKESLTRVGKPCGKSFVPKSAKCSKPTTARYGEQPNANLTRAAQVTGGVAAAGAVAILLATGLTKQKRDAYRRNVPKSALEAEKLALEFERQFRDRAAARLGKRPQDVTGFEASTYNYKDKGYDRGFGGFDNNPEYFGQTPNSRGAVVMLSYADDGKDTRRGQGGFKLATNGVFKEIWGEHDILPFANNISQPNVKTPDDLTVRNRTQTAERIRGVAGELGERAYKTGYTIKDLTERFAYLRENVDKRGFNPDAIRVAAFVAAQRRLTGKPVDIMSYSNGGNVATEALEILKEMGYRDVKVVNVAGPTFGMFEHSRDNMRTWLSKGDEFYKNFGNNAFQGSNAKFLDNDKIPHGIMDAIDPNNKEFGGDAAADNRRARRSYMLDEQLRKEAYTFLTVDRKRSGELVDEIVWRVSDKKPFEGDLQALFGDNSQAKAQEYTRLLTQGNKEQAKQRIQDEIEDRMIEVWYGGYNSSRIKNRAKALRREVAAQATRSSTPRPKRPIPLYERVARIRKANPELSREAAMRQARKEMREAA